MALEGFTRSASKRAPTVILPANEFVQLAIACVPFHSCKHALHIVVRQARLCHTRPLRCSYVSHVPEFLGACSSSQHRALSSAFWVRVAPRTFHFVIGFGPRHDLLSCTVRVSLGKDTIFSTSMFFAFTDGVLLLHWTLSVAVNFLRSDGLLTSVRKHLQPIFECCLGRIRRQEPTASVVFQHVGMTTLPI